MTAHTIRPETARQAILLRLMHKQAERYLALCRARSAQDLPFDQRLHDWFCDFQTLIHREYAKAINEDESIVAGKQWLYDRTTVKILELPQR